MKTIEEARTMLESLGKMQSKGLAVGLPCPRCGRNTMDCKPTRNALSRRATVYICNPCGTDEALRDMLHMEPLPLIEWSIIQSFDEASTGDSKKEG